MGCLLVQQLWVRLETSSSQFPQSPVHPYRSIFRNPVVPPSLDPCPDESCSHPLHTTGEEDPKVLHLGQGETWHKHSWSNCQENLPSSPDLAEKCSQASSSGEGPEEADRQGGQISSFHSGF